MNIQEMREKRNKLLVDAQAIAVSENKTTEQRAQMKAMVADAASLLEDISTAEAIEAVHAEERSSNRPPLSQVGNVTEPATNTLTQQREAFRRYLINGEKRTLGPTGLVEGTSGNGGYLVPTLFQAELEQATLAIGGALQAVRQISTVNGDPLQWPMSNDTANYSTPITETTVSTSLNPTFTSATLTPDMFATGFVPISRQLLADSAIDVEALVRQEFAVRVARGLNLGITNGTTSGNVSGLLATGTIGTGATVTAIGTGTTTHPYVTDITYTDVLNLYGKLDPSYRANASWMLSNSTFVYLLGVTDNYGRPLFQPDLNGNPFSSLLGRPIVINQAFPTVAVSTVSILFGDFSKYILRNCGPLEILRTDERYIESGQVAFFGWHRQAGVYLNAGTNPICALKQKSS